MNPKETSPPERGLRRTRTGRKQTGEVDTFAAIIMAVCLGLVVLIWAAPDTDAPEEPEAVEQTPLYIQPFTQFTNEEGAHCLVFPTVGKVSYVQCADGTAGFLLGDIPGLPSENSTDEPSTGAPTS